MPVSFKYIHVLRDKSSILRTSNLKKVLKFLNVFNLKTPLQVVALYLQFPH